MNTHCTFRKLILKELDFLDAAWMPRLVLAVSSSTNITKLQAFCINSSVYQWDVRDYILLSALLVTSAVALKCYDCQGHSRNSTCHTDVHSMKPRNCLDKDVKICIKVVLDSPTLCKWQHSVCTRTISITTPLEIPLLNNTTKWSQKCLSLTKACMSILEAGQNTTELALNRGHICFFHA